MKQPKKLTRQLKEAVAAYYLNPNDWMLLEETDSAYAKIIHKETGKIKIIDKYAKERKRK